MEIKLHNNDRLHFDWTKNGALSIQLYKPGCLRDGHGLLLSGSIILDGDDLREFFAFLAQDQPKEAA